MNEIEFLASLPSNRTAIAVDGEGATKLSLDIPETEIANALKLVMLKGKAFRVKIELRVD